MNIILGLINWFLRLFGLRGARALMSSSSSASSQSSSSGNPFMQGQQQGNAQGNPFMQGQQQGAGRQLSDEEKNQIRSNAVQGDVQGAENLKVHGTGASSRVVKHENGADLVEDEGRTQWVERINTDGPREQWRDEWGPLSGNTALDDFVYHEMVFDQARAGDPLEAERKLQGFGYRDVGHFYYVRNTVVKYFATPTGPMLSQGVFQSQEFMNAGMKAAQRMQQDKMQSTLNANPELLAPVEGCTVEQYAEIAARVAQNIPQDQLLQLLAKYKLDLPAWQRVNKVWTDRMSKDTTATIATIYGKAFMNSGQGQYGAAGQQAAATGWNGAAAQGKEPVPFEKMCEIAGAMSAWAKTGQDVNALLHSQFGMTAMDYSNVSTWWFTQMTANLQMMDVYEKKRVAYESKFMGGAAQGGADKDIQF